MDDAENRMGLALAVSSSIFIGSSFIIKKKGLIRSRSAGKAAADGGHAYLKDSLWWIGLLTMILGEVANFAAYAFAPAILVTPLGALSVIVSAVLASVILDEKLKFLGKIGCGLCIVGSTVIVLNAPAEQPITSVEEITMKMETNLAFILYTFMVVSTSLVLIFYFSPRIGTTNVFVYVGICSLVGSISVIGVKALSLSLKLTFNGQSQLGKGSFWGFVLLVVVSIVTQMNYLNKALDTFNTAVVTPIYYVLFTTATIVASAILFNGWGNGGPVGEPKLNLHVPDPLTGCDKVSPLDADAFGLPGFLTVVCGFVTIVSGVFLLHISRQEGASSRHRSMPRNSLAMELLPTDEVASINNLSSGSFMGAISADPDESIM